MEGRRLVVQKKAYDWWDSNIRRATIDWIWIRSKKGRIGGVQISEGLRLVGFKYQKCYDWLNSQFHCSHLESRGVPGKTREIPGKKTREIISLSFPVHDFRWCNFRWRHIRWFNFRSRLRTRSLPVTSYPVTSLLPIAPPQMRFELSLYTTLIVRFLK